MPLNQLNCVQGGAGNTGFSECFLDPKNIVGAILLPKGTVFDSSDTASPAALLAAIQDLSYATLPSDRAYPIGNFNQITDNSEDVTIATLGYGDKAVVKDGDTDWTLQFAKGGLCLSKAMRKFNGSAPDVLFYDANNILYGVKSGTNLKGVPLTFIYTTPFKINNGSDPTVYSTRFVFKPIWLNDNVGFVPGDSDTMWASLEGIQDVALTVSSRSVNVLKVKARVGCASVDLYDLYDTELAVVGAWIVTAPNGNQITLTSVAIDANIKGWTLTMDTSDGDYSVGVVATVKLASPTVLDGLGVSGYESNSIAFS